MENNEDSRFALVDQSLKALTNEVSRLAGIMERLITVEERNQQLDQKIDFIRSSLEKDITALKDSQSKQTVSLEALNIFMWKLIGVEAAAVVVVTPLISIFLSRVF